MTNIDINWTVFYAIIYLLNFKHIWHVALRCLACRCNQLQFIRNRSMSINYAIGYLIKLESFSKYNWWNITPKSMFSVRIYRLILFLPQIHSPKHASNLNARWLKWRGLVQENAFRGVRMKTNYLLWGQQPQKRQYIGVSREIPVKTIYSITF